MNFVTSCVLPIGFCFVLVCGFVGCCMFVFSGCRGVFSLLGYTYMYFVCDSFGFNVSYSCIVGLHKVCA